jgi:hypothetical protein
MKEERVGEEEEDEENGGGFQLTPNKDSASVLIDAINIGRASVAINRET